MSQLDRRAVLGVAGALGLYPVGTCLADFARHIRSRYDDYGRIIRDAGIKAQ